jgi:hypothetical protein
MHPLLSLTVTPQRPKSTKCSLADLEEDFEVLLKNIETLCRDQDDDIATLLTTVQNAIQDDDRPITPKEIHLIGDDRLVFPQVSHMIGPNETRIFGPNETRLFGQNESLLLSQHDLMPAQSLISDGNNPLTGNPLDRPFIIMDPSHVIITSESVDHFSDQSTITAAGALAAIQNSPIPATQPPLIPRIEYESFCTEHTEIEIQAISAKYLSQDMISVHLSEMSFATNQYLKKYGLTGEKFLDIEKIQRLPKLR